MTADRAAALYKMVGLAVRAKRRALQLTQAELAAKVGIGRTSVTNLEAGRQKAPLHELLSIADALSVDLRELMPPRSALEQRVPVALGQRITNRDAGVAGLLGRLRGGRP